jgi:cold shock CspA family protein
MDIPRTRRSGHARAVDGQIKFYDEFTAWGIILGDDGGLYVVRGTLLSGSPLQVGDRVVFEPRPAPGGPRAAGVQRVASAEAPPKAKE